MIYIALLYNHAIIMCIIHHIHLSNFLTGVGLEGGIEINEHSDSAHSISYDGKAEMTANTIVWCMAWMAILGSSSNENCIMCKSSESTFVATHSPCKPLHRHRTGSKDDTAAKVDTGTDVHVKLDIDGNVDAVNNTTLWGISKTASFALPQKMARLILEESMELGHADDFLFKRVNSKHGSGTVGILTHHMIDRSEYYEHALKLALIPFIWPEYY